MLEAVSAKTGDALLGLLEIDPMARLSRPRLLQALTHLFHGVAVDRGLVEVVEKLRQNPLAPHRKSLEISAVEKGCDQLRHQVLRRLESELHRKPLPGAPGEPGRGSQLRPEQADGAVGQPVVGLYLHRSRGTGEKPQAVQLPEAAPPPAAVTNQDQDRVRGDPAFDQVLNAGADELGCPAPERGSDRRGEIASDGAAHGALEIRGEKGSIHPCRHAPRTDTRLFRVRRWRPGGFWVPLPVIDPNPKPIVAVRTAHHSCCLIAPNT